MKTKSAWLFSILNLIIFTSTNSYSLSEFKCGSDLTTYNVVSNAGLSGNGVRCVKVTGVPPIGPVFSWYGEGNWGGKNYRHVGEAYQKDNYITAKAADISGNGESFSGKWTGGELRIEMVGGTVPTKIIVSGAWSETWNKVDKVDGLAALNSIKTCGPNFAKYRAESTTDRTDGFGVRCFLPNSRTWYGEGRWVKNRYAHLGYASAFIDLNTQKMKVSYGLSDICKTTTQFCNYYTFGKLDLVSTTFPHIQGKGYLVSGASSERWLPYTQRYPIRVDFVRLSDDATPSNPTPRQTPITAAQISRWVDYFNSVYSVAQVELLFVEQENGPDLHNYSSTLLNNFTGDAHPKWAEQKALGNSLARPGKMQVYVHSSDPSLPAQYNPGGGFSSSTYNFAVMPGFNNTSICNVSENLGLFAHESGHYYDLIHTFRITFNTVQEASDYFVKNGAKLSLFDGDGLTDTAPDPFIGSLQCQQAVNSVKLGTQTISLPRENILGYWPRFDGKPHTLSAQQIIRVQNNIQLRGLDY